MVAVKVTFTLDEATMGKLNAAARRVSKPKSEVIREAVADYYKKTDRLGEAERKRMLRRLDEMMARPPTTSQARRRQGATRASPRSPLARPLASGGLERCATLLDASLLIDSLAGHKRSAPTLRRVLEQGEQPAISTIVVYEWLRGPRTAEEIADQEFLFPAASALPFETEDAGLAAEIYRFLQAGAESRVRHSHRGCGHPPCRGDLDA
jgi:predicted transcriptional regulator